MFREVSTVIYKHVELAAFVWAQLSNQHLCNVNRWSLAVEVEERRCPLAGSDIYTAPIEVCLGFVHVFVVWGQHVLNVTSKTTIVLSQQLCSVFGVRVTSVIVLFLIQAILSYHCQIIEHRTSHPSLKTDPQNHNGRMSESLLTPGFIRILRKH